MFLQPFVKQLQALITYLKKALRPSGPLVWSFCFLQVLSCVALGRVMSLGHHLSAAEPWSQKQEVRGWRNPSRTYHSVQSLRSPLALCLRTDLHHSCHGILETQKKADAILTCRGISPSFSARAPTPLGHSHLPQRPLSHPRQASTDPGLQPTAAPMLAPLPTQAQTQEG